MNHVGKASGKDSCLRIFKKKKLPSKHKTSLRFYYVSFNFFMSLSEYPTAV
jgi:hypothetical protein